MRLPGFSFRNRNRNGTPYWTDDRGEAAVARLLDRFAGEALSPSPFAAARMRAEAVAAFRESFGARAAAASTEGRLADRMAALSTESPTRRPLGWTRRRMAAAVCAVAILTLSTVGVATAESGPGQPFYRLRLGLEAVNLPPAGSNTRLTADLDRADARLNDVAAASARADWNGAGDAADAYREVVASIVLPDDVSARQGAVARLEGELIRLEQLRAESRAHETTEIDAALAVVAGLLGVPIPTPLPAAGDTPTGPGAAQPSEADASSDDRARASTSSEPGRSGRDGAGESRQPDESFGAGASGDPHGASESQAPGDQGGQGGGRASPGTSAGGGGGSSRGASPSPSPGGGRWPGPYQSPGGWSGGD